MKCLLEKSQELEVAVWIFISVAKAGYPEGLQNTNWLRSSWSWIFRVLPLFVLCNDNIFIHVATIKLKLVNPELLLGLGCSLPSCPWSLWSLEIIQMIHREPKVKDSFCWSRGENVPRGERGQWQQGYTCQNTLWKVLDSILSPPNRHDFLFVSYLTNDWHDHFS